jgi:replication-associated recombination protein RarA
VTAAKRSTTVSGFPLDEVVSALQKAVRRADTDSALYWACELELSGHGAYCWRRLRVMASEDVGLAVPQLPATIRALYESWAESPYRPDARLFLAHAVLLLARAPKSRLVDHALIAHWAGHDELARPIPDEALDMHTRRGRQMGRGVDHSFESGAVVSPDADVDDAYRETAERLLASGRKLARPSKPRKNGQRGQGELFERGT